METASASTTDNTRNEIYNVVFNDGDDIDVESFSTEELAHNYMISEISGSIAKLITTKGCDIKYIEYDKEDLSAKICYTCRVYSLAQDATEINETYIERNETFTWGLYISFVDIACE